MTTESDFNALLPVAEAFERLGVPYYIGGSVASSMHGVARSTIDIDIVARIETRHIDPLVKALDTDYYIDAQMIRDAIRSTSSFNLIHFASQHKVDVFIARPRPFDQSGWQRVVRGAAFAASEREFPIASAE